MSDSLRTTVLCRGPRDGSGDTVIDLSPEALEAMNVGLRDNSTMELVHDLIGLKPIRDTDSKRVLREATLTTTQQAQPRNCG